MAQLLTVGLEAVFISLIAGAGTRRQLDELEIQVAARFASNARWRNENRGSLRTVCALIDARRFGLAV